MPNTREMKAAVLVLAFSCCAGVAARTIPTLGVEGDRRYRKRVAAAGEVAPSPYLWQTNWTTSDVDNFNYLVTTSKWRWQQKYLSNFTFWGGPGFPIFIYDGNEGAVELFLGNAGLLYDLAPAFGAGIVAIEHRYYGDSLPFGSQSYQPQNLAYFNAEQALADYVKTLDNLKANLSAPNSPVVAFGGSYGGMLAAWHRMKYPSSVVGAIAASAPILQVPGIMDPHAFNAIITQDYRAANPEAPAAIYAAFQAMLSLGQTQAGRDTIKSTMRLCGDLNSMDDVWQAMFLFQSAITSSAEANYPYPADFLGPMPAWPVSVQAAYFTNASAPAETLLAQMADGVGGVFLNYTGEAGACFNTSSDDPPGVQGNGWNLQCCQEVIQPIGQYGLPNDMFWPAPFDFNASMASCEAQFNTTPRPFWVLQQYGGLDVPGASNIVFSNGGMDPWYSGGITANVSGFAQRDIIPIVIPDGAHHADLRGSNPLDPPSFVAARAVERAAIVRWIAALYERTGQTRMLERARAL